MNTPPARRAGRRPTPRHGRTAAAIPVLLAVLALEACGGNGRPHDLPAADPVVQQLATGLAKGSLSGVPLTNATSAQADYAAVTAGMDGLHPQVSPGTISYDGQSARAVLHQTWLLGTGRWTYDSTATLTHAAQGWQVDWTPAIVQPQLGTSTRLRHTRSVPPRASIIGSDGSAIVELRDVYTVGIDKQNVPAAQQAASATSLARLVKVDPAAFVKRVQAAGKQAFVPAITLRKADLPSGVDAIAGALAIAGKASLAPTRTFAQSVLGTMGSPTAAQVSASHGDIEADDQIGLSGLELRHDAQLRGTVGHTVTLVTRASTSSASPSAPAATASASPATTLFHSDAVPGKPLTITLDQDVQTRAEKALASTAGIASMVVLDRSTGAVRAAANSPDTGADPAATAGSVAPGSTMKVVDSLALLRQGYTPTTTVSCPTSISVNGKRFNNDSWYPSTATGNIPLTTAVAQSCNTAFVGLATKVSGAQQQAAAASLGMGVDHDAGFPVSYGSVPDTSDAVTHAANMIGQGQVTASPLAMAGVAASVGAGHTVVPWLVQGNRPTSSATPLTASEATQLQTIMKAVVNGGTASGLRGLVTGAKTGTAEFSQGSATKTHAWMIAWNDRWAMAVMVNDGVSGAATAGPILKAFLS